MTILKYTSAIFILFTVFLSSCSYEKPESLSSDYKENLEITETVILKERNKNYPWHGRENDAIINKTSAVETIGMDNMLGISWKTDVFPIDNPHNKGFKVIDMQKVPKNKYEWGKNSMNVSNFDMFSFADFSRYLEKSCDSSKFEASAGIDWNFVDAKIQSSYSNIFSTEFEEIQKMVFGCLDVWVKKFNYKLLAGTPFKKDASLFYLSPSFKQQLYGDTPENNFITYGGYVLTNFDAGGKVSVMYQAKSKEVYSSVVQEQNMDAEMSGTFSMVNGKMSFGYEHISISKNTSKFSENKLKIQSIGGSESILESYGLITLGDDNVDLELQGWVHSLNDESNHEIIEIREKGLSKISDFILEKNLKDKYEKMYTMPNITSREVCEPYIMIESKTATFFIHRFTIYLVTKYGDKLKIGEASIDTREESESTYLDSEIQRLGSMLGVAIKKRGTPLKTNIYYPIDTTGFAEIDTRLYKESYFDRSQMSKITNDDGSIYLFSYNKSNDKYYVYTIYNESVRYDYAMTDFLNTVPEIQCSEEELKFRLFNNRHIVNAL